MSGTVASNAYGSIDAMPRTPVSNAARHERLAMRATTAEKAIIDRLRGGTSISDFLRQLVRDEDRRRTALATESRKDHE